MISDAQMKFQEQFNHDWIAAQPAAVQAIMKLPVTSQDQAESKSFEALKLSISGVSIDLPIVLTGFDPWLMHCIRTYQGIPYIGSMQGLLPPLGAVIAPLYGVITRPWPTAPPGSLPTVDFFVDDASRFDFGDESSYPKVLDRLHSLYRMPAPPPPPPPPGTPIVGDLAAPGIRYAGIGAHRDTVENNKPYQYVDGTMWIAHTVDSLMGWTVYFTPAK